MKWDEFVGTWSFPMESDPEGIGWLAFLHDGRAFQSVRMDWPRPDTRVPMRLRMSIEAPGRLRAKLVKGSPEGWIIDVALSGNTLCLAHGGKEFFCTRASADQIPRWFLEELERAIASWPS